MKRAVVVAVVGALVATTGVARAQTRIALDEIVGSWQADDEVQFVQLRMLDTGQNMIGNVAALVFYDATGSSDSARALFFTQSVANGAQGATILVATTKARDLANVQPDFLLPTGFLQPTNGRVCYAVEGQSGLQLVDCVAYGTYTGDNATFGNPTPLTPDDRALERAAVTGRNRADWTSVLDPVLANNAGGTGTLPATLCGDGLIDQGEVCDGTLLGGATCASLGFAKGKLSCFQCHYDTSKCTTCGNDAINGKEECDGSDLGGRSCASLGYTGGTLACTGGCTLDLSGCDPAFFVAGGGPAKTDCLGEWRVANTAGGPDAKGHVAARQACKDGTAGCDADGVANGTCVFTVAACFVRTDARFAKCVASSVSAWSLTGKVDPGDPSVAALVAAVAALGPSTVAGAAVSFSPDIAEPDTCAAPVGIAVPAGKKLVLRARTVGPDGKPKDADVLRLACLR